MRTAYFIPTARPVCVCVCVRGALGFPMWNHSVHATDGGDREKKRDRVPQSGEGLFENRAKGLQPPRSSCCVVQRINSGARPITRIADVNGDVRGFLLLDAEQKGIISSGDTGLAPSTPLHLLHSGLFFLS